MSVKLYHKDLDGGIPEQYKSAVLGYEKRLWGNNPYPSQEIVSRIDYRDKKHNYTLDQLMNCIQKLSESPVEPFEVEVTDDKVTKYCVRIGFDDVNDIAIVIRFRKIITAWLNRKDDNHSTLRQGAYDN